MNQMTDLTRREFAGLTGMSAAAFLSPAWGEDTSNAPLRKGKLIGPDQKLKIAAVGCGGKGVSDIQSVSDEQIVALCDVDEAQAKKTFAKYPNVPKYQDYRVMLEEMDNQIDAVTVSTPDHMHFPMAMDAIRRGKHVFVQKPLTSFIGEARELQEAARRHGVVTVMGNQGHAGDGCRLVKEWVDGGLLGDVSEVHVWTGKLTNGAYRSELRGEYPAQGEELPASLDWNLWTGVAPLRPFSRQIAPKRWRGWWDYGNGALGDIGCHTMDPAFFALDLGAPTAITAKTSGFNDITFPDWSIITYEFPARGDKPPVKLVWYDGGQLPKPLAELEGQEMEKGRGFFMIGTEGVIYDPSEKCESPSIIPESKRLALKDSFPPRTIPRVPSGNPGMEWVAACKGGPTPGSNFDYAAPLTEMVLLGNLAIRVNGKRIEWDTQNMQVTNMPELNIFIRPTYRNF